MNRSFMLFLGGVVLFCFILLTSFAWSKVFYHEKKLEGVALLNIKLSDKDNTIDTTQDYPSFEPREDVKAYSFTVNNEGVKDGHYQLLLEEDPISNKVGYRQEDLLNRDQLNYELILNGTVIKRAGLSTIKNNILDNRIIQANKENKYFLKIWVHDKVKAGEWENKYYHYKVTIKVVGE